MQILLRRIHVSKEIVRFKIEACTFSVNQILSESNLTLIKVEVSNMHRAIFL